MCYDDGNRPIGEFIMPVTFDKTMYPKVKQWLIDNPQYKSLSEPIKQSLGMQLTPPPTTYSILGYGYLP